MLKLNNKGWGMKEMIIISLILFICLFIASYYIYVLYNRLISNDNSEYYTLEVKLKNAASKYIIDYNVNTNDPIAITLSELRKKRYILIFEDDNSNACDGYVLIKNYDYTPYITCNDYTTDGYYNYAQ